MTVGHRGERVGELVYAEVAKSGRLDVVAVLHDDTLSKTKRDIYFSPEAIVVGPGVATRSTSIATHAALLGLALTTTPAGLGLAPIRWRRGDIRSSADRGGWPVGWAGEAPLLARCVDRLGTRCRVERLRREPELVGLITRDGRRAWLADDELVATRRSPLWLRHDRAAALVHGRPGLGS